MKTKRFGIKGDIDESPCNLFAKQRGAAACVWRGQIRRNYPDAQIVFAGRSPEQSAKVRFAFAHGLLGCNGIYNSFSLGPQVAFNTMPYGFQNHLIFSSINFRQEHMEQAIAILCDSNFDVLVSLIDKTELTVDPLQAYEKKIYAKGAPLKTAVIWNSDYMEED